MNKESQSLFQKHTIKGFIARKIKESTDDGLNRTYQDKTCKYFKKAYTKRWVDDLLDLVQS